MSISCRTCAIFSVVLRVHFSPVMGSPAVSCSRRISMASIISGVFFPPACARRPFCGRGPLPRPELTVAVSRGPRCEDQDRGSRPVDDRHHGPVSATPVRHTIGAVSYTHLRAHETVLDLISYAV